MDIGDTVELSGQLRALRTMRVPWIAMRLNRVILASAADLEVTQTELRVTLEPQSSPHRTRAIAALCTELNRTKTIFPGSRLRLRYSIRQPE